MTEEPFNEAERECDREASLKTAESLITNLTRGCFNEEDVTDTEMKDSTCDKRKIPVIKELKLTQKEKRYEKTQTKNRRAKKKKDKKKDK